MHQNVLHTRGAAGKGSGFRIACFYDNIPYFVMENGMHANIPVLPDKSNESMFTQGNLYLHNITLLSRRNIVMYLLIYFVIS